MIKLTINFKFWFGFRVDTYIRRKRAAVFNQRAKDISAGFLNARSILQSPDKIACAISQKKFWSVFKSFTSTFGISVGIASKFTTFSFSHFKSSLVIIPQNRVGPAAVPYNFFMIRFNGSSLKCKGRMNHCDGRYSIRSISTIISPVSPVFTLVPSDHITRNVSRRALIVSNFPIIVTAIVSASSLSVGTNPMNFDPVPFNSIIHS